MAELDEGRVRQAMATSKIQSFSSELVALQSCRNEDDLYQLLVTACESEPFLMSRLVRVANSVAFAGHGGGYAVGANECLLRIGLSMGKQIAEDFLIDQALGRIARANRFSRGVWREARHAGSVAYLFQEFCEEPFDMGGPSLPAIMSFLGELFAMSLVKAEYELPPLAIPPLPDSGQLDLVGLSLLALTQLQLPEPVEETLRAIPSVVRGESVKYLKSASALLLCRALVKASAVAANSFAAVISPDAIAAARDILGIDAGQYAELAADVKRGVQVG